VLLAQIKEAGHKLLSVQKVQIEPEKVRRKKMGPVAICPVCNEAYPSKHGEKCLNCQGETPYSQVTAVKIKN
jgi:formylmethanofuran dehydrogenase subunit E